MVVRGKNIVKKRSVRISGHPTSITLEDDFWRELKNIAKRCNRSVSYLVSKIDRDRTCTNLSSAIRLYVLHDLKSRL